jgi:SM-20-related protein
VGITPLSMIANLAALESAAAEMQPYPHVVVRGLLGPEQLRQAIDDFPRLDMAGLFLAEATQYGPYFGQLLEEMQGAEMRAILGRKLGIDLTGRPTLATLRSCCQAKDGRIHPDSKFKLATILLYLNEPWAPQSGRLRILRSPTNIEDYAAEVPPEGGLMVGFKVQKDSWHGHRPFVGQRRYLMINYCQDQAVRDSEAARHRMTGRVKKFKRLFGLGRISADQPAETN